MLPSSPYAKPPARRLCRRWLLLRRGQVGQEAEKDLGGEPKVLFTTAAGSCGSSRNARSKLDGPPSLRGPVDKTVAGAKRLATTGHSTNFILDIYVPADVVLMKFCTGCGAPSSRR